MRRLFVGALLSLASCTVDKPPAPKPSAVRYEQRYVGEWFEVPRQQGARCRVSEAHHVLAESSRLPYAEARVRPDVHTIDVGLACEAQGGAPLASRDALPLVATLLLVRGDEARAALPSPRDDARDHALFEVPEPGTGYLPSARRYAADTGLPVVTREQDVAKLRLTAGAWALEVTLRHREEDAAFDRLLDELARGLASGAALETLAYDDTANAALTALARTYRDVVERFSPARLELTELHSEGDALRIALSLTRPRSHGSTFQVARFELGLARTEGGAYRVKSFDNRAEARTALECEQREEQLQRDLNAGRSAASERREHCNALGTLLPGRCAEIDPALLSRALEVGARCREGANELPQVKRPVPDDFQLTMRRGRSRHGLDREPRYVVALFHQGQVVFHGRHWVTSQERSDGRTLPALLSGLYEHVRALDWFERRGGGGYDPEHCIPSEDDGDVITVQAAGKQRMVLSRDGCRGPFSEPELARLRRHVELVAGISGWTEPAPVAMDQGAEHWALSGM